MSEITAESLFDTSTKVVEEKQRLKDKETEQINCIVENQFTRCYNEILQEFKKAAERGIFIAHSPNMEALMLGVNLNDFKYISNVVIARERILTLLSKKIIEELKNNKFKKVSLYTGSGYCRIDKANIQAQWDYNNK